MAPWQYWIPMKNAQFSKMNNVYKVIFAMCNFRHSIIANSFVTSWIRLDRDSCVWREIIFDIVIHLALYSLAENEGDGGENQHNSLYILCMETSLSRKCYNSTIFKTTCIMQESWYVYYLYSCYLESFTTNTCTHSLWSHGRKSHKQ